MVAIHGSARPRGNSRRLLDEAISAANASRPDMEVELVRAYASRVDPCIACGGCREDQVGCIHEGDGWHDIEASFRAADALLLASPVYFMGLPSPVKAIVDRLQALWWYRKREGEVATNEGAFRRAGLILVAAGDHEVFGPSRRVATAAFNTLGFQRVGEVLGGSLEGPDEAGARPDLLEAARELGARLVE